MQITPNILTAVRVVITGAICFILLTASHILMLALAFLLFVLACLTDWWDGELARKKSMITNFGKIADPIADKILVLGLLYSFSSLDIYSAWWVLPILVREVTITGIRTKKVLRGEIIAAEFSGKIKTVVQLVAAGAAFLILLAQRTGQSHQILTALQVNVYIWLVIANALTLISGYLFLKRNVR